MIARKLSEKSWYKWFCLILSMMIVGINYTGQQMLSPLLAQINQDIIMTNTQVGLLTSSYVIAGIFSPLMIAALYKKWDVKPVLVTGGLLIIVGFSIFMCAHSFPLLLAARFIAGIGATTFMTSPLVIVSAAFREARLGTAMGIYGIASPLASFVALNTLGKLGGRIGWRGVVAVVTFLVALVLLIVILSLHLSTNHNKGIGQAAEKDGELPARRPPLGRNVFSVATLAFAFGYCGLSYITFSPRFYQIHGYSQALSSFIPSLYMGLNIFFAPFVGVLIDRDKDNKRKLAVLGLAMLGALDLLMISPLPTKMLFGVLLGVSTTAPPVVMFSLYADIFAPEQIAIGTCIISMVQNIGSAFGPVVTGAMLDYGLGFIGMFAVMAVVFFLAATFMSQLNLKKAV